MAVANYPETGGLMSYGTNLDGGYRQVGVYTGRILKGAKPVDLPVAAGDQIRTGDQSPDREDARPHVPPTLLARADEVIE